MCIRFHFIANLHIDHRDTIDTVFNQIKTMIKTTLQDEQKHTQKQVFSKQLKIKENTAKIEVDF